MKKILQNNYKYINALLIALNFLLLAFNCGEFFNSDKSILKTTGYEMIYGFEVDGYKIIKFNVLGLLMMIFMMIAIIIPFLEKHLKKYSKYIVSILLVISSLLAFILPNCVIFASSNIENYYRGLALNYIIASLLLLSSIYSLYFIFVKKNNE